MTRSSNPYGVIERQIMWNRLIGIVEEQAQTLIRAAFSQGVRESGDLSAGVFDRQGRMVAQAITGTPGHVNSMAVSVVNFLSRYPLEQMQPGDAYITNDPWLSAGHYHDVTVVSPAFHRGKAVALFANTIHIIDMGGRGFGPDSRQVYEEGINIPIMPIMRAGTLNEDLLDILRTNVREPLQMEGDMHSQMACNAEAGRKLSSLLEEFGSDDIDEVSDYIIAQSQESVRKRIRELPDGVYRHRLTIGGYDTPIDLVAAITVEDDHLHIDYSGTSKASPFGINVVLNFTTAYSVFGVNCIVAPDVPCNAGSLAPITVSAPVGSILNVQRPFPVSARHTVGQMLPDLIFGCLSQAVPDRVPAEGAGTMWNPMLRGGESAVDPASAAAGRVTRDFDSVLFNTGGTGGRPGLDGLSAVAFPSNVKTVPTEVVESLTPIIIWRKELREGSGGAGQYRGGLGQVLEIGMAGEAAFSLAAMFERAQHPARGFHGGKDGKPGVVSTVGGRKLLASGRQYIQPGERVWLELPGGGGYGDPKLRDHDRVREDVLDELISREDALRDYGVAVAEPERQA
ncbi:MAG: hydantoinase B/oxoprolinase family protein [Lautropia sp.]